MVFLGSILYNPSVTQKMFLFSLWEKSLTEDASPATEPSALGKG